MTRDAEAGLAAAGHADADRVRHQVARLVQDGSASRLPELEIEAAAEVEQVPAARRAVAWRFIIQIRG